MSALDVAEEARQVLELAARIKLAIGVVTHGQSVAVALHAMMVATARVAVEQSQKGREGAMLVCISEYMLEMAENYPAERDPPTVVR